jgi:hypothetical protein
MVARATRAREGVAVISGVKGLVAASKWRFDRAKEDGSGAAVMINVGAFSDAMPPRFLFLIF